MLPFGLSQGSSPGAPPRPPRLPRAALLPPKQQLRQKGKAAAKGDKQRSSLRERSKEAK